MKIDLTQSKQLMLFFGFFLSGLQACGGDDATGEAETGSDMTDQGQGDQSSDGGAAVPLEPPPELSWSAAFGSPQFDGVFALTIDSTGRLVWAGYSFGTVDLGGGDLEGNRHGLLLASFDPDGQHLWSMRCQIGSGEIAGLAANSLDDVIVAGFFSDRVVFGDTQLDAQGEKDTFLFRLDSGGDLVGSTRFGISGHTMVQSVAVDGQDNVVMAGHINGSAEFGQGVFVSSDWDVFVVKLDNDLNLIWSRSFGDADEQYVDSVTVDRTGAVVLTGRHSGTLALGDIQLTCPTERCLYVAKLDSNGEPVWARSFNSPNATALAATDSQSNIVLAGAFRDPIDFGGGELTSAGWTDVMVVKLSGDGQHQWSRRYGNDWGWQGAGAVAVDVGDNIHIAGMFGGVIDFGGGELVSEGDYPYLEHLDLFLATLSPDGEHIWSSRFGGVDESLSDPDTVEALAVGGETTLAISGRFSGSIGFGGEALVSPADDGAFFIARFAYR